MQKDDVNMSVPVEGSTQDCQEISIISHIHRSPGKVNGKVNMLTKEEARGNKPSRKHYLIDSGSKKIKHTFKGKSQFCPTSEKFKHSLTESADYKGLQESYSAKASRLLHNPPGVSSNMQQSSTKMLCKRKNPTTKISASQQIHALHQTQTDLTEPSAPLMNYAQCPPLQRIIKLNCYICGGIGFPSMSALREHQYTCVKNFPKVSSNLQQGSTTQNILAMKVGEPQQIHVLQTDVTEPITPLMDYAQCPPLQQIIQLNCDVCGGAGFPSMSALQEHQYSCIQNVPQISSSLHHDSMKVLPKEKELAKKVVESLQINVSQTDVTEPIIPSLNYVQCPPLQIMMKLKCNVCGGTGFTSMSALREHQCNCFKNISGVSNNAQQDSTNMLSKQNKPAKKIVGSQQINIIQTDVSKSATPFLDYSQCPPLKRIMKLNCDMCGGNGFASMSALQDHKYSCMRNASAVSSNFQQGSMKTMSEGESLVKKLVESQQIHVSHIAVTEPSTPFPGYDQCPPLQQIMKLNCDICGTTGFQSMSALQGHKYSCTQNFTGVLSNTQPDSMKISKGKKPAKNVVESQQTSVSQLEMTEPSTSFIQYAQCPPLQLIMKINCDICGGTGFTSISALQDHQRSCVKNIPGVSSNMQQGSMQMSPKGKKPTKKVDNSQDIPVLHQTQTDATETSTPFLDYAQYLTLQPTLKFNCYICGGTGFSSMSALQEHQYSCMKNFKMLSYSNPPSTHIKSTPSARHKVTRQVYKCNMCNSFFEAWNLFHHFHEIHNCLMCLHCLSTFSNADELTVHLFKEHGEEEYFFGSLEHFFTKYDCGVFLMCCTCERMFDENDNFADHICS